MKRKLLFAGFATADFINNEKYIGGAAGASSINAAQLGHRVSLVTVLANDKLGKWYQNKLSQENVDIKLCNFSAPSLPTCLIENPASENSQRTWKDNGSLPYLKKIQIPEKELSTNDLIFLFNATYELVEKVAQVSERKIIYIPGPQIVSGKNKISDRALKKSYLVFGNEQEENQIMKHKPFTKGVSGVVITLGKKGGRVFTQNGSFEFDPPPITKVVDTTGAGDSFALGFSLSLLAEGLPDSFNKKLITAAIENGKKLTQQVLGKKGSLMI